MKSLITNQDFCDLVSSARKSWRPREVGPHFLFMAQTCPVGRLTCPYQLKYKGAYGGVPSDSHCGIGEENSRQRRLWIKVRVAKKSEKWKKRIRFPDSKSKCVKKKQKRNIYFFWLSCIFSLESKYNISAKSNILQVKQRIKFLCCYFVHHFYSV